MRTMGGRPVLLQRFPAGASGPSFFQKRVPKAVPPWLQTTVVSTPNGTTSQALVVADIDHVLWAVNLGCLGFHVWPYRADDPGHTDELRIDLDPTPGIEFGQLGEAAHELRALLDEVGVTGYSPEVDYRRVVEGRTRPSGLRRLQPERAAQDGVRCLVRSGPTRRAGFHADRLGGTRSRAP